MDESIWFTICKSYRLSTSQRPVSELGRRDGSLIYGISGELQY